MKYFNSLVIGVNTVSIGKDMKVPSAYKGDLKFEKNKYLRQYFKKAVKEEALGCNERHIETAMAGTYLQLPLLQWGAGNNYILVLSS
jgi:hypothetical protein